MKIRAYFQPHVTASESENRSISGLLLPFGEVGYTSAGALTAAAGSITIPDDPSEVILDIEHDYRQLVGKAHAVTETEAGIIASFEIIKTRAGDDALEEVRAGLRKCLSVELSDVETDGGKITAGKITGAGLVLYPAFESARLAASRADAEAEALPQPSDTNSTDSEEKEETMNVQTPTEATAARVPAGIPTGMVSTARDSVADLTAAFIAANGSSNPEVLAALSDIIPSNWYADAIPGYVGELWNGKSYQRRVIPRFGTKDLKSRKISGWRWVDRPEVGMYDGNKTAIPSNTVSTEEVEIEAFRIAGGHDIDRAFVDFESPEFWNAYWHAMTESYARLSDGSALAQIASAATKVEAGEVPTDMATGLVYIVDGLISVLNETDTLADTAFVAPDLWRAMLLTPHDSRLAYLDAAMGVEEGTLSGRGFKIVPESRIDAGSVLVTTREAATIHEFGNGAPIRVTAQHIANGGIDAAVFGYLAANIHDAGGLAHVKAEHGA